MFLSSCSLTEHWPEKIYNIHWLLNCIFSSSCNRWLSLSSCRSLASIKYIWQPTHSSAKHPRNTVAMMETWLTIRTKSEGTHKLREIPQSLGIRKRHRRWMKSEWSNPTSAQPPSLLPRMLHQLIWRQGDSKKDAITWPAVHVHLTHDCGVKTCRWCFLLFVSTKSHGIKHTNLTYSF